MKSWRRLPAATWSKAALYNLALCERLDGQPAPAALRLQEYRERFAGRRARGRRRLPAGRPARAGRPAAAGGGRTGDRRRGALRGAAAHRGAVPAGRLPREAGRHRAARWRPTARRPPARSPTTPFRLSALARWRVLSEDAGDLKAALAAYRDLMKNASDPQLVAAATDRAAQIATVVR